MYTGSSDSMAKETLKSLSCNNGWSYSVFWRFDQRNSSLLTLQEAYYEEQMGVLIDDMLLQVHILGGGQQGIGGTLMMLLLYRVIGQVAFTKKHRWMLADAHFGTPSPAGSVESSDVFQDHSDLDRQFSIGIKTIAVISVEPFGVVQFGSTQKLPERLEFVNQTKELFQGIEIVQRLILPESEQSCSNNDTYGTSGLFTSLTLSKNPYCGSPNLQHSDSWDDLVKTSSSAANIYQSFHCTSDFQKMNAPVTASSLCENHFRVANTESEFYSDGGISDILLQQSLMESATFFDFSSSQGHCNSPWSFGDIQESSILNSDCSYGLFADTVKTSGNCSEDITNCQNIDSLLHSSAGQIQSPTILNTFEELLGKDDSTNTLSKYCAMEDVFQWFAPITDQSNNMLATALSSDLSNASGVVSSSSSPKGYHTPTKIISDNQPSTSVQSSITNSFDFAEKEKCADMLGIDTLFERPGMDLGSKNSKDREHILMPVVSGGHLDFSASSSECVSELYDDRRIGTTNTLFSKLGLHQHFTGTAGGIFSVARSDFEGHLSSTAKRRKIESSLLSSNQLKCLPDFARSINPVPSVYGQNKTNHIESKSESKSEVTRTLGVHSCLGDSSSVIDGHTISSPKKHEQPAKMKKKRAKPGTKQISRDRVQIAARLADLRELIPNGEKMSIDRLLHRTIKHLLFLQSVTRHAEKFEQPDELKNGMVQKEKASSSNGATWACEVGNETMFCPLIVEDLSIPGQMLIEILCEEQGFFLEIVDIIRGFGFTILKGEMEVRKTKLWALFTVEAEENQQITRQEIFSSLVQLLQLTGPTEIHKNAELVHAMDGGASLFNNCQQSCVPFPISLADKFLDTQVHTDIGQVP